MKYADGWRGTVCVVLALAAFSPAAGGQESGGFAVGPYVLDVSQTAAIVAFHLAQPMSAEVRWTDGASSRAAVSANASRSHFIHIVGLEPGRVYQYQVVCNDGEVRTPDGDPSYQIRTACLPGESFVFAVYGDTRPGDSGTDRHHRDAIAEILSHEPSFSLVLGDMVDHGEDRRLWESFFAVESPLLRHAAIWPVMGDSDRGSDPSVCASYFPGLDPGYYRFAWGDIQFIGLRAWGTRGAQPRTELDADGPQVAWLKAQLQDPEVANARFRVVFLHDPVYICRGRAAETLQRAWAPIFERYNVDVVFASQHLYERSHHNDVTYILSGGAGAELIWPAKSADCRSQAEARRHHFCRADVQPDSLTIRSIATDGTVLDEITLTPRSGHDTEPGSPLVRRAEQLRREIVINPGAQAGPLPIYLFSHDCAYCRRLIRSQLPSVARKYGVTLRVLYFDLSRQDTYNLFLNAGAEFGRQGADIPALFIGRAVYGGEREIETAFPSELSLFKRDPEAYTKTMITPFRTRHDLETLREESFMRLTPGIVLGAGLIDGVNPCAFATIVFLVSYLSVVRVSRGRMIVIGSLYVLAVFLTYLAIGLVFYHSLRHLLTHGALARAVNIALFAALTVLAFVSLFDAVRAARGASSDVKLQLPAFFKIRIRDRIRNFARNKITMTGAPLALGAMIAGLELTCTGQVYVPIVTMIAEPYHRAKAAAYLLAYNVAFIVPLVVVFALAVLGVGTVRLAEGGKGLVAATKFAMAALFTALAAVLARNLGWL